jgi:signal recognition particle receptor subunit alpha
MRKWDAFGGAEEDDGRTLDYSAPAVASTDNSRPTTSAGVDQSQEWGSRTAKGEYVLKDIGEEMDAILSASNAKQQSAAAAAAANTGLVGQGLGKIGGLFRNVVGGKTLTKEDLEKPLRGVQEHLVKKNVAQEAAVRLCESVEQDLVGMKTSSFTSKYSLACMFRIQLTSLLQASRPP